MGDVLEGVLAAVGRHGDQVRLIREARAFFDRALQKFTGGADVRWWWERLPESAVFRDFNNDGGFRHLLEVVPVPDQPVLFVIEDDDEPFFPFLEATPRARQSSPTRSRSSTTSSTPASCGWSARTTTRSSLRSAPR